MTKQMRENIRAAEETAQTLKTEAEEARENGKKTLRKAEEETTKRLELEKEV